MKRVAILATKFFALGFGGGNENATLSIAEYLGSLMPVTVFCVAGSQIRNCQMVHFSEPVRPESETQYNALVEINGQDFVEYVRNHPDVFDVVLDFTCALAPHAAELARLGVKVVCVMMNGVEQALQFGRRATQDVGYVPVSLDSERRARRQNLPVYSKIYLDVDCEYLGQVGFFTGSELTLGWFGNFRSTKGPDLLIRIGARLRDLGCKVILAGYEPEKEFEPWFDATIAPFVDNNWVTLLPPLDNEGKLAFFERVKYIVEPKRCYPHIVHGIDRIIAAWYEAFGLTMKEALRALRPVYSTGPLGSPTEIIRNCGGVIPTTNDEMTVDGLAEMIRQDHLTGRITPELFDGISDRFAPGTGGEAYAELIRGLRA
jgi:glycosyltransferase involved in cell wall biosynthesis